jgi:hypothetical protein
MQSVRPPALCTVSSYAVVWIEVGALTKNLLGAEKGLFQEKKWPLFNTKHRDICRREGKKNLDTPTSLNIYGLP